MTQLNNITILGTGTSTGIPMTGCHCPVCRSSDSKNKRFRTSVFLETVKNKHILVDTSPDLRMQCLENHIERIDAVLITHEHADHLHGIDDLRPYCFLEGGKTIPVFAEDSTCRAIKARFPYIFHEKKKVHIGGGIPKLDLHPVLLEEEMSVLGESFRFFLLPHGHVQTLCFIHQKMGYIVDCASIPDRIVNLFREAELDLLIIDCLRVKPHQTHLHLEAAIQYAERIAPKFTGAIHFSHHIDHQTLTEELMERFGGTILPLYDGQQLQYGS